MESHDDTNEWTSRTSIKVLSVSSLVGQICEESMEIYSSSYRRSPIIVGPNNVQKKYPSCVRSLRYIVTLLNVMVSASTPSDGSSQYLPL